MSDHAALLSPSNKKKVLIVAVAVIVLVAIITFTVYNRGNTSQASTGYTIVPAGNVSVLQPMTAHGIEFLMSTNGTVTGHFTATGNVTMFILSDTGWNDFPLYNSGVREACPTVCPPYLVMNDANSGDINVQLAPGRYYLAFDNKNSTQQVSITITQSVVTTGVGHVCQTPNC